MQNEQNKSEYGLWVDLPFFLRTLKRWIYAFLALTIAVGCLVYVGADLMLKDTYTATALVSVVPKDNKTASISDSNINSAITRDVAMWDSSALTKEIKDSNPERKVSGDLSAEEISGTSIVKLTATANTAQDAYYLLSSAIRNYHQIESDFDNSYVGVILTKPTGDSISVNYAHPLKFAALGFAAVLCGCCGVLFVWCCVTNVLHQDTQAAELLAVSLYETFPHVNKKKHGKSTVMINQLDCDMDYIESMDKLTSRVEQHMKSAGQKNLMVTSIQENEGKSTIAVNLAMNLARRGRKTVLVDLDFRKPALHKIFGQAKRENGMVSDLIKTAAYAVLDPVYCENTYDLGVLFQYRTVRDSDRILEHENFRTLLRRLSEEYEYVILDTPPMAPVRDSEVIAQGADCSLLVIRQDFSRAAVANDVTDQLEECGAPCIGAVLNNCSAYRRTSRKVHGNSHIHRHNTGKGA